MTEPVAAPDTAALPLRSKTVSWQDPRALASAGRTLSGLEFLRQMAAGTLPGPPIAELFGMTIMSVEPGDVVFGCEPDESTYNPLGVVHGGLACMLSLNDLADRPPHVIGDEALDTGRHRLRFVPTPHVPHNWESGLWFDEATSTLFAGDLFTHIGDGPALVTDDVVGPALAAEDVFHSTSHGPQLAPTLERLAELEPTTLAVMHGSSYRGDGRTHLRALAAGYAALLAEAA